MQLKNPNYNQEYYVYMSSLIWPFIDTYWVTLTFILKFMLPQKTPLTIEHTEQRIQWLAETLHDDGYIKFYESCSLDTVKNSIRQFNKLGVLEKKKVKQRIAGKMQEEKYWVLTQEYSSENKLAEFHNRLGAFRSKPSMKIQSFDKKFRMEDEEMLLLDSKL